jgi:hypothetical protein
LFSVEPRSFATSVGQQLTAASLSPTLPDAFDRTYAHTQHLGQAGLIDLMGLHRLHNALPQLISDRHRLASQQLLSYALALAQFKRKPL